MKKIFIVAGDPSGDLIASQLVTSLRILSPDIFVTAIGGRHLKKVSDAFLEDVVSQHALGFAISPKKIMYFRHILNDVIEKELKKNPYDVVIPVDFYGFNWRVAKVAKTAGVKVVYYVSPQFYASRPGRAEKLRPFVDLFLCLFPFEEKFFKERNLPVRFIGHPVLDNLPSSTVLSDRVKKIEPLVGLLPGSRPKEIRRHLPLMMESARIIAKKFPGTRFILFTVPHFPHKFYTQLIQTGKKENFFVELIQDEGYQWRSQLDFAIASSGFETFENALLGIPMVIIYKTDWITYVIAKSLIRVPFIGMPNLLAGKEVSPEYIQWKATANRISKPILKWMNSPKEAEQLRHELLNLRSQFGEGGASQRAAQAVLESIQ